MRQQMEQEQPNEQLFELGRVLRRNNRGCKSKDFYSWPEQSFEEMDSPLAVQQYIQQVIRRDPSNIDEILKLPEGQDLGAWKIEHLRLFCMQLNGLAAKLQECCLPETCNQMTATEQWIFLCAAHKQPNECPAINYTRHTLDGAASLLNSTKYFPSRVTIKESSVAKLGSVCRRVYRIFSHAYYHHFTVFDEFERETHLCKRFSKFVTIYELMPKDSLIVPSDGSKPEVEQTTTTTPQVDQSVANIKPSQQNDSINEESKKDISSKAVESVAAIASAKADSKVKKAVLDDSGKGSTVSVIQSAPPATAATNVPASGTATTIATPPRPAQVLTNTMVKGSSNAIPRTNSTDSPLRKSVEGNDKASDNEKY